MYIHIKKNKKMNFSADATKIISARIPMQEYIKLLTSATKLKLSVSEYLIWKVYYKDEKYKVDAKKNYVTSKIGSNDKTKNPSVTEDRAEKYKPIQKPPFNYTK